MKNSLSSPELWLTLHGDILYRYGLARVGDREVAEDLVQETLLAALKAKNNFSGKSKEQTWLIGILKHKIIDYFRKASREQAQEYDDSLPNDKEDDYFDQQGSWQVDFSHWSKPDQSMQQEQFMQVLHQCIAQLPKRMAQLFVMSEFEGMKSKDICELMSLSSMSNLWAIQSRARVQLRHCLDINWINQ